MASEPRGLHPDKCRPLVGQRATVTATTIDGGLTDFRGTVLQGPVKHGFVTRGGAWARYSHFADDVPAWRLPFRRKGKQKPTALILENCVAIQEGW